MHDEQSAAAMAVNNDESSEANDAQPHNSTGGAENSNNAATNTEETDNVLAGQSDVSKLKLPGAASLYEQLDKLVMVCLRDGRNFFGWLRSFDQYANLTLDGAVERLTLDGMYADIDVGIFVIRGENVMMLGEVNEAKEAAVSQGMKLVSEDEMKRLMIERRACDNHVNDQFSKWPIPEEV